MGRAVRCSDDLDHRILKSEFIPSDFAKSGCISRLIFFSDRKKNHKLGIRSHSIRPKADNLRPDSELQISTLESSGPVPSTVT